MAYTTVEYFVAFLDLAGMSQCSVLLQAMTFQILVFLFCILKKWKSVDGTKVKKHKFNN